PCEQHRTDQPYAVIELVAAGAGFAVVPLSVHGYADRRIVCRRLDPPPPELELTLARARGVDSPAINALLDMALQIAGQQRSFLPAEGRADPPGLSDLSARRLSAGERGRAGTYQRRASARREFIATRRPID